jgi:hypothetical protein
LHAFSLGVTWGKTMLIQLLLLLMLSFLNV